MVSLKALVHVASMNADRHTHEEVLGAFSNLAIDLQQVGALQGLVDSSEGCH